MPVRSSATVMAAMTTSSSDEIAADVSRRWRSVVMMPLAPDTVTVTNYMIGSLPLTGTELGGTGLVAVALLLIAVGLLVLRSRRRNTAR